MEPTPERKPKNALREALASTGLPANGSGHGCDVSTTGAQHQQPFLAMTTLNSRLQLALLNRKKGRNLLEKGFTLVELMIVIVIVGILSSVALPNFLNQTVKAKGAEAKSQVSAITKTGAAEFQDGGEARIASLLTDTTCVGLGGTPDSKTDSPAKFNYACSITDDATNILTITATGAPADAGGDSGIAGKVYKQSINLGTGKITLDEAATCKVFGGTLTTGACA